jgi:hypothetical protein
VLGALGASACILPRCVFRSSIAKLPSLPLSTLGGANYDSESCSCCARNCRAAVARLDGLSNHVASQTKPATEKDTLAEQVKELKKQVNDLQARSQVVAADTAIYTRPEVQDNRSVAQVKLPADVVKGLGEDFIVLLTMRHPTGGYPYFNCYWKKSEAGFEISVVDTTVTGPGGVTASYTNRHKDYPVDWIVVRNEEQAVRSVERAPLPAPFFRSNNEHQSTDEAISRDASVLVLPRDDCRQCDCRRRSRCQGQDQATAEKASGGGHDRPRLHCQTLARRQPWVVGRGNRGLDAWLPDPDARRPQFVFQARLELCNTKAERIKAIEDTIKEFEPIVAKLEQYDKEGIVDSTPPFRLAQAFSFELQIALQKANQDGAP